LKEKLFDIARRVPFLAMTIVEKKSFDGPWLFRAQPLQTDATPSIHEVSLELAQPPTTIPNHPMSQKVQQPSQIQITPTQAQQEQRLQQIQNLRLQTPTGPIPIDPKKVAKSSTAPNLPTSNSLSEMFRVI
jgi:hypothetical protein